MDRQQAKAVGSTLLTLTAKELVQLTGYKWPSKQVEALRNAGVRHIIGPDGHPRVARAWLELAGQAGQTRSTAPRFEDLCRGKKPYA